MGKQSLSTGLLLSRVLPKRHLAQNPCRYLWNLYLLNWLLCSQPSGFVQPEWKIGQEYPFDYTLTTPYTKGGESIVAELYSWSWGPYDYQSPSSSPSLNYLGVIATAQNTGTVSLTLNASNFDWTQALYVLSLTSGLYTYREYVVVEESTFSAHTQCQYWQKNVLPNESPFQSCPLSNSLFAYTPCTGAQQYPNFIPS